MKRTPIFYLAVVAGFCLTLALIAAIGWHDTRTSLALLLAGVLAEIGAVVLLIVRSRTVHTGQGNLPSSQTHGG
jgi:hypothetical protein